MATEGNSFNIEIDFHKDSIRFNNKVPRIFYVEEISGPPLVSVSSLLMCFAPSLGC